MPPLSVDLTWPRSVISYVAKFIPGMERLDWNESRANDPEALGYFDVEYLDDELLVIRQQNPGGVFALVKVDNYDP